METISKIAGWVVTAISFGLWISILAGLMVHLTRYAWSAF